MNVKMLTEYLETCERYGFEPTFECLKKFKELQKIIKYTYRCIFLYKISKKRYF